MYIIFNISHARFCDLVDAKLFIKAYPSLFEGKNEVLVMDEITCDRFIFDVNQKKYLPHYWFDGERRGLRNYAEETMSEPSTAD